MTDLTDFLNVVVSAEDWAGFGADGREPEEPMKQFTIDVPAELYRRVRAACARRLHGSPHVIRLRRPPYDTSMPGAGAVHHIKSRLPD